MEFNNVQFQIACTADQHEFNFSPDMSITWIWYLDPNELGIPDKEGQQKIVGLCYPFRDSVYINAPKFRGGKIFVGKKAEVPEIEYQKLRDSIGATVVDKLTDWSEYWQIKNHSIDSIVEKYSKDYRINSIEAIRSLQFSEQIVTDVDNKTILPLEFSLSQNFPNPFNPSTTIKFSIPKTVYITLKIYNTIGQEVGQIVNQELNAGTYTKEWNASKFASGIYYYRLTAGDFVSIKKLLLIK